MYMCDVALGAAGPTSVASKAVKSLLWVGREPVHSSTDDLSHKDTYGQQPRARDRPWVQSFSFGILGFPIYSHFLWLL